MGALALVAWAGLGYAGYKLLLGWLGLRRQLRVLSASGVPHPPSSERLLGSLEIMRDVDRMYAAMTDYSDEYGGIYYVRILWNIAVSWGRATGFPLPAGPSALSPQPRRAAACARPPHH